MNSLPGNPYAECHQHRPGVTEDNEQWAIAQATLALAFEQRTANLIAITNLRCVLAGEGAHLDDETQALLAERFGLSEDS
ncbi:MULTISPECIES: hypothetical protein [Brevibacterium]|uniref:Uncharacterized protein n=1 Tax=Brevibacterium antiquum CNRZ 918 TaxID=1255637 RepID=A0A2H1KDB5_9MICO|nr:MULTISPECIES: hypothetical protein [Brevibacterium]SMX97761.1 hypothetical protein BANT918_02356 [Brevibacterium antiquum CNRZ 918]HCG55358.1 hypothetical protein [Brevibacterium sp.]